MRGQRAASLLFAVSLLATQAAQAGRIDVNKVLFGIEYTFQDQEMVNETGRKTITTPYKEDKAKQLASHLAQLLELPESAITIKTTWKPGLFLNVPGDGQWVINPEPVTIEVNTTPRKLGQIVETAKPIFDSAQASGLVAYVNPAAERSGMGHIHVGGSSMAENPFFANPLLLRNMIVYLHKHPALLHGFAEAYDIGMNSNIETYHQADRQEMFQNAVEAFDLWYEQASPTERKAQGFNRFLAELQRHDKGAGFFQHYRFMNLEHVKRGPYKPTDTGKITVEFRNFRPPKDPETAHAFAELLVAMMEKQSQPEYKETFRWIHHNEYLRFNTATKVAEDWQDVRRDLGLNNAKLDEQLTEYVKNLQSQRKPLADVRGVEVLPAYSEKDKKGTRFEVRLSPNYYPSAPVLNFDGRQVEFEKAQVGTKAFWISVVDTQALGVDPSEFAAGSPVLQIGRSLGECHAMFAGNL